MLPGQGTYFMIADIRPLLPPGSTDTDVDFCQKLTEDVGVTMIPVRLDATQPARRTTRRLCVSHSTLMPSLSSFLPNVLLQQALSACWTVTDCSSRQTQAMRVEMQIIQSC